MWKLIFNTETNKGTGCNREPEQGEFARDLHPSECAWFNVYPERYQWNGTGIEERPEWGAEQAAKSLEAAKKVKSQAVMDSFAVEAKKPVSVGAFSFDGGWSSLDKLDRAITFAQKLGLTERTFYETDETPHVLPLTGQPISGEVILFTIAMAYDSLDGKMRAMIKSINQCVTMEELNAIEIVWS